MNKSIYSVKDRRHNKAWNWMIGDDIIDTKDLRYITPIYADEDKCREDKSIDNTTYYFRICFKSCDYDLTFHFKNVETALRERDNIIKLWIE